MPIEETPAGIEQEVAKAGKEAEKEVLKEVSGEAGGKCPFCEIIGGRIPAKKVYEDDSSLAFLDINPRNPGHTLVVPKGHYATILDIPEKEAGELFKAVRRVAAAVQRATKAQGISISQSNGAAAGQLVPHMHFHIIPRFMREGPLALEASISVKKMPEESLDKVAETIKAGMAEAPAGKPAKKKKAEEPEETEGEIDFDF
jgi:histidine triad (HIT) family protein